MLKFLISSASRRKVLIHLLNNQDREYHLRELSRETGEPAPVIKRELDRLDQIGFILSWSSGNRRHIKVNKNFFFLPELKSLVDKSIGVSNSPRVAQTFTLEGTLRKRKTWEKRSKKIMGEYGRNLKRQRPRHPVEMRMMDKLS
jgi:hypothetical protein